MHSNKLITIIALVGILFLFSSSVQSNVSQGVSCEQAVNICQHKLIGLRTAIVNKKTQCGSNPSNGCLKSLSVLQEQYHRTKVDCSARIREACQ